MLALHLKCMADCIRKHIINRRLAVLNVKGDATIFTAGVGENATLVREKVIRYLLVCCI